MTNLPTESIINEALISLARSFLQYVVESWPWVDQSHRGIEQEVRALAARQRQDASELVRQTYLETHAAYVEAKLAEHRSATGA